MAAGSEMEKLRPSSFGENLDASEPRPPSSPTESGSVDTEDCGHPEPNRQEPPFKVILTCCTGRKLLVIGDSRHLVLESVAETALTVEGLTYAIAGR